MRKLNPGLLLAGVLLLFGVASRAGADDAAAGKQLAVGDDTFGCISDMKKVKHFFVDNLLGDLDGTVAVANSATGGVYPPGTVLQLIPTEVMIKQKPGFSPATKDWEFFELEVSPEGSKIRTRGFAQVNNRFGGNCFGCHVKARPEFDFVCELDHGCDPIPVTRPMIAALQHTDPRCKSAGPVSPEDAEALRQLGEISKPPAQPGAK
ncbi:MAG: hypothetical protein HYY48_03810 [Gammaproteobacteria bacterium]|nr:hypothetical protein [Gammaproteobacteria bacterium]